MNEKQFINVKSLTNGIVVMTNPEYHFRQVWPRKGTVLRIDKEILTASFYRLGTQRLFSEGNLYIEDKQTRIDLGLESDGSDGSEVKELIVLDDKMLNRIVKLMPAIEVKTLVPKLSPTQLSELSDYALEHYTDLNMDKIDIITKATGINLLQAIDMKKAFAGE